MPLAYLALTLALTWPMVLHLAESLNEVGDPPLQAWTLAWNAHALRTDPARIWQAPIFYPYADTLAYADHHLVLSVVVAPLIWLTDNPALALNLLVLLSFVLSAWAVCTLAHDLTGEPWAAFVAGAGFAFCAYRMAHIVHLNLLQTAWLPWSLVFLQRLLRRRELGGGRTRDALLFGLFAALQATTAIYYAFFTVVVLSGAIALWALAVAWRRLRQGTPQPWATAGKVLLGGALAALLATPLMLPYLRVSRTLGIVRSVRELDNWSAPLGAYLSVDVHNRLYNATSGLGAITVTTAGEMILFPGAAIVLLALLGLLERGARNAEPGTGRGDFAGTEGPLATKPVVPRSAPRAPRFVIALLGGAAFVLSLGTGLRLERGAEPLPIPLPYQALYARVPGFGALRVPSRWGWLVTLALALLAALGLARLLARCAPRRRPLVGGAALALVLLETVSVPVYLTDPALLRDVPPVYRWLGAPEQRDVGVVLELPVHVVLRGQEIDRIAQRQYFGRYHWKQLVVSYSGLVPFGTTELITRLERLPEAETLRYLQILGVDTVVVHRDQYDAPTLARLLDAFDASPLLQHRAEVGAAAVYRLLPDPELAGLVPSAATGATIFVSNDERVPGMLALALVRRWREAGWRLYGDGRTRYYAPLGTAPAGEVAAYALLADREDPARHGYAPIGLRWRSQGLAFYAADPALRASLDLGGHAGGSFHPSFPAALDLTVGANQLRAAGASAAWARQLAGPTAYLELDVASLTSQALTIGGATHQLAPGLTVVRTPVALDQPVSIAGQPAVTAIQRIRVRDAPAESNVAPAGATLAASAEAAFAGSRLQLSVQAGGTGSLLLDVWGAAAYDDRPVHLLSGAQPVLPGGGALGFDADLLTPAAPWLKQRGEPVDGRYIAYLKDAARPGSPGLPVAKFVIRRGALVDVEPVPLLLTTIP